MRNNSFLSRKEVEALGFLALGNNVLISSKASFYSTERISIGNNVRIDDFSILSGKISIGSFVHISAYVALYGRQGIQIDDYAGLSPRVTVFSASDDFNGEYIIGPFFSKEQTNLICGKVHIQKYAQLGVNSVVFPGVVVGEGAVCGALSLINNDLEPWTINVGIPSRKLKNRSKNLLNKF